MKTDVIFRKISLRELIFIVLLNSLVFIFYAFDKRLPGFEWHQILFFLNFAIAGLVINYVLLPLFLYKGKYVKFAIYTALVVAMVILIEEAMLEPIFYADTRGRRFSNLFYNLLNTLPTLTILAGFKFAWDALKKQKEVQQLKNSVKERLRSNLCFWKTDWGLALFLLARFLEFRPAIKAVTRRVTISGVNAGMSVNANCPSMTVNRFPIWSSTYS